MRLVFVPPSIVLTDNKCILPCAISPTGANNPLKESNEEERRRMKHNGAYIFIAFSIPSRSCTLSKDRFRVTAIMFSLEDQNKIKRTAS